MIHHLSFSARDPARVGGALATILGGKVMEGPKPFYNEGSTFVCVGDEHGTLVVVEPWDVTYIPSDEADLTMPRGTEHPPHTAFHALLGSTISVEEIGALAEREGWPWRVAAYGPFTVVNVWLEGTQLLEFATDELLGDYLATYGPEGTMIRALAGQEGETSTPSPDRGP